MKVAVLGCGLCRAGAVVRGLPARRVVGVTGPGLRGPAVGGGGGPIGAARPVGPRRLLPCDPRHRYWLLCAHESLLRGAPICSSSSRPLLGRRTAGSRISSPRCWCLVPRFERQGPTTVTLSLSLSLFLLLLLYKSSLRSMGYCTHSRDYGGGGSGYRRTQADREEVSQPRLSAACRE